MQRAIVSYSDIADAQPPPIASTSNGTTQPPPAKRRKSKGGKANNSHATPGSEEHWTPEESRELTHEEIWDDSALIDAWNAAAEEYEVLNGPEKTWKHEPVHKSALWYTTLPEATTLDDKMNAENDSTPFDFNSYIPQSTAGPRTSGAHDNSQTEAQVLQAPSFGFPPIPSAPTVSSDVALQNAYGAWYWAGYWSGVYQTLNAKKPLPESEQVSNEAEIDESVEMELEDALEDGEV